MDPLKHNLEQTLYDAHFINKFMLFEKKTLQEKKILLLIFCRLETPKGVFWQTVKTQMKCNKTWHFIRACFVC